MIYIIVSILVLFAATLVHEGGHAIAATMLGVPFTQFSIGIPWPSKTTLRIGKFTFSPWLLLAFVLFDDKIHNAIPLRKKVMIALAGPMANFAAGLITALLVFGFSDGWTIANLATNASIQSVGMLFTGQLPVSSLSSPVGIISISYQLLTENFWKGVLIMWIVLNFGIPAINLLPIPALDGGQIMTAFICHLGKNSERVIKTTQNITLAFFVVIMILMAGLTIKDIANLIHF